MPGHAEGEAKREDTNAPTRVTGGRGNVEEKNGTKTKEHAITHTNNKKKTVLPITFSYNQLAARHLKVIGFIGDAKKVKKKKKRKKQRAPGIHFDRMEKSKTFALR